MTSGFSLLTAEPDSGQDWLLRSVRVLAQEVTCLISMVAAGRPWLSRGLAWTRCAPHHLVQWDKWSPQPVAGFVFSKFLFLVFTLKRSVATSKDLISPDI